MIKKLLTIVFFIACACSILMADDQSKTTTPRSGEGIYGMLRRNGYSAADKDEFVRLNKKKLGKNESLILGVKYLLPAKAGSTKAGAKNRNPLFGKQHEEYTIKSEKLKGSCYYLVSGHGGIDPGTTCKIDGKEICEDEYAYDITLRLAKNLLEHSAKVYIIIQDTVNGIRNDKYLLHDRSEVLIDGAAIPEAQTARLEQRVSKIHQLNSKVKESYKRVLFIHIDDAPPTSFKDIYFIYKKGCETSRWFSESLRKKLEEKYRQHRPNRKYSGYVQANKANSKEKTILVLDKIQIPAVLLEIANIRHVPNQSRFMEYTNRQRVADWLTEGLIADYTKNKKSK